MRNPDKKIAGLSISFLMSLTLAEITPCGTNGISPGILPDTPITSLDDLPLIEIPSKGSSDPRMAVFFSGDGGWVGIDKDISGGLAQMGVATIGVSSLRYFWKRRSRVEASADLERIIRSYMAKWGKRDLLLLGYSLGADILPTLASALPPDLLNHVVLIGLMGPAKTYDLEFHIREWIPIDQDFPFPILADLEKLRGKRILCIHGNKERVSLCHDLDSTLAHSIEVRGTHHFRLSFGIIVESLLVASALTDTVSAGSSSRPISPIQLP